MSLAPAGADLEELRDEAEPLDPDVSALSLADPGADLTEGQQRTAPPPPPQTDHLSIEND